MIEVEERPEEITAPAKRWRNRWTCDHATCVTSRTSGRRVIREAGDEWWGVRVYPSKDAAETAAKIIEADNWGTTRHVGSFPVEDET